jgi:hypothetical protein
MDKMKFQSNVKKEYTCVVAALNSIPSHVERPSPAILAKVTVKIPAQARPMAEFTLNKHPSKRI